MSPKWSGLVWMPFASMCGTEKFQIKMAVATKIFLQEVKFTNYEFICHDCLSTEKYRKDYMSNIEIKPHIVLTAEAAIMYKIGAT